MNIISRLQAILRQIAALALALTVLCGISQTAIAGPYTEPGVAGFVPDPGDPVSSILNPELRVWAGTVTSFTPAPGVNAANGNANNALGPIASTTANRTVSLGDLTLAELAPPNLFTPGQITLQMAQPLRDGTGWDLAVFENAFGFFPPDDDKVFAELAYVDVSTDGVTFARFPSVSLTSTLFEPFGPSFAGIDPTDVHNLAGMHQGLVGTPFDFAELTASPAVASGAVQLGDIRFVRFTGVPGNGQFLDSMGNGILAAWPTTDLAFGNGGFDLDAVAGRYPVPEPQSWALLAGAAMMLWRKRCRTA